MTRSIFILCTYDSQGGAEQVLRTIAEYHAQEGDRVDVFFLKKRLCGFWDEVGKSANVKLHFTSAIKERNGLLFFIINVVRGTLRVKPTIVYSSHSHLNSTFDLLRQLKFVRAKYHIARESTHIFRRFTGIRRKFNVLLYKIGYKKIDLLICQTDEMKHDLLEGMPSLKKLNIEVIPNPINISSVWKNAEVKLDEHLDKLFNSKKCVVTAGRLITIKGFEFLIRAFARLPKDYHLLILGEGDQRTNLENIVNELGISNDVSFVGYKANPMPYFKHAYLCVVPSIKEGFPNALLQMMVLNNRVVSTLCAGGIEHIPGIFTCDPGNIDALYSAIIKCLSSNETVNKQLMLSWLENRNMDYFISKTELYLNNIR